MCYTAQTLLEEFSSSLVHVCSRPEYGVMTFQPIRVTLPELHVFLN